MPDAELDTTRWVESVCKVPVGAGVLRLLVPGVVAEVFIDGRNVAGRVEPTRWVISATRKLFIEDMGVEF
jgi:hypothetical protein